MIQAFAFTIVVLVMVVFICWFATPLKDDPGISGDWRDWGFPEDPLNPTSPLPDHEIELV